MRGTIGTQENLFKWGNFSAISIQAPWPKPQKLEKKVEVISSRQYWSVT